MRAQIALGLASLAAGNNASRAIPRSPWRRRSSTLTQTNVYVSLSKALGFLGRAEEAVATLEEALDDPGCGMRGVGVRLGSRRTSATRSPTSASSSRRARFSRARDADAALDAHAQVTMHWSGAARLHGGPGRAQRDPARDHSSRPHGGQPPAGQSTSSRPRSAPGLQHRKQAPIWSSPRVRTLAADA